MGHIDQGRRLISLELAYFGALSAGQKLNLLLINDFFRRHDPCRPAEEGEEVHSHLAFQEDVVCVEFPVGQFRVSVELSPLVDGTSSREVCRLMLGRADGVVFVASSEPSRAEANVRAMHHLLEHLRCCGRDPLTLPLVVQYHRSDPSNALSVSELRSQLNPWHPRVPDVEAMLTAPNGPGVLDTFKAIITTVLGELRSKEALVGQREG